MEAIKAASSSLKDFCLTVALHPINHTTIQESNHQGVLLAEFCKFSSTLFSEVRVHALHYIAHMCVRVQRVQLMCWSPWLTVCLNAFTSSPLKVWSALRVGSTSNLESRLLHSDGVRFVHHLKGCRHAKDKLSSFHFYHQSMIKHAYFQKCRLDCFVLVEFHSSTTNVCSKLINAWTQLLYTKGSSQEI